MDKMVKIDELFENLNSKDGKIRYEAMQELIRISENKVEWLYDKWFVLLDKLTSENSFQRSIGLMLLASGKATNVSDNEWHTLKLCFAGSTITGFVDNAQVMKATDSKFAKGTAGLLTGFVSDKKYTTAQFDNLIIKTTNGVKPKERTLPKNVFEIYSNKNPK